MNKADVNGDGEIDYNELMALIKEISKWLIIIPKK